MHKKERDTKHEEETPKPSSGKKSAKQDQIKLWQLPARVFDDEDIGD